MILNWLILFIHILFSLHLLWKMGQNRIFIAFLSPIVWNFLIGGYLIFVFLILRLDISSIIFQVLLLYIPIILIFSVQWTLIQRWKEKLLIHTEFFLNSLIAQIKIGYSFRSGFKTAITHFTQPYFQNYFMEILEFIVMSTKLRKEIAFSPMQQIIQELQQADRSPQCLEHLENLRQNIRLRSLFRQKVQTALIQVRTQSLVLMFLYAGLLIFVLSQYGFKYPKTILTSAGCFILGLVFLFRCGRQIKWTI